MGWEIAPPEVGDLPRILYVSDIAQIFCRSQKAVRSAVSRGTLPPLRNVGGRACWFREDLLSVGAEIRGRKHKRNVKISAGPYNYDKSRMMVTFTIPGLSRDKGRVRKVAPAGLDQAGALAWGEAQRNEVMAEVFGDRRKNESQESVPAPAPVVRHRKEVEKVAEEFEDSAPTVDEFWVRFESEYLPTCKPATRRAYRCRWQHDLHVAIGTTPIDHIDRHAMAKLRARVARLSPRSRNFVIDLLQVMLRQAKIWGVIAERPKFDREKEPKRMGREPYTEAQLDTLIHHTRCAGEARDRVFVLLLAHAGLRSGEVCALRWGDISLDLGVINVAHNLSDGQEASPKGGEAAPVGMSSDLREALEELPQGPDDHVLLRPNGRALTPAIVDRWLRRLQHQAGVPVTSPYVMRHTCLTILADRGLDPLRLQAHARHKHFSTTEDYIKRLQQQKRAREAAAVWDIGMPGRGMSRAPVRRAASALDGGAHVPQAVSPLADRLPKNQPKKTQSPRSPTSART
ncbi:site-specific integrase [Nannocystis sp. ILAH1]|uniref:tyrosine-type recombinase/integrase n=1 Tax=Nannocystis sp. ILAH1 TaxID=2996789 RepID=UPI0022706CDB|nr:site-specific integrase [Nannocystis sp. ILAH1]MCY0989749.1 site-specific integrase [Nannocystis sp. ILAH1]